MKCKTILSYMVLLAFAFTPASPLKAADPAIPPDRLQSTSTGSSGAQAQDKPEAAKALPAPDPRDVSSVDAIMGAVYDVISGPAGTERKWDRMRCLFAPGARLIPTFHAKDSQAGAYTTRVLDVEQYISGGAKYFATNGFFEKEIARRSESFGHIAQVFSTYESRHNAADPAPFERGINSFQLMNDGKRWWIISIFWEGEGPGVQIPKELLTGVHD